MSVRIPILEQQSSAAFVPIGPIRAVEVADPRGKALQGFAGALSDLGEAASKKAQRERLANAASIKEAAATAAAAKASADAYQNNRIDYRLDPTAWRREEDNKLANVSAIASHGQHMGSASPDAGVTPGPAADTADAAGGPLAGLQQLIGLHGGLSGFSALTGNAPAPGAGQAPGTANASGATASASTPSPFTLRPLPSDGLTGNYLQRYDTLGAALLAQLPEGSAGAVQAQLAALRQSGGRAMVGREAAQVRAQRQSAFTSAVQGIAAQVAAAPDTLPAQLAFVEANMIDIGPGQQAYQAQLRDTLIGAALQTRITRDPDGMALALAHRQREGNAVQPAGNEGKPAGDAVATTPAGPDDHLAEHPLSRLLTPAQATAWLPRAQAESARARSNARAGLLQTADTAERTLRDTGSAPAMPSEAECIGALGLEQGKQRYAQLREAQAEGENYVNLRALPSSVLNGMRPQAGEGEEAAPAASPDATPASPAQRAIERLLRTRREDAVQAAFDAGSHGLQTLALTPAALQDGSFAAGLRARHIAAREIAHDYQTPPALLSRAEVRDLAATLRSADPAQQQAALKALVETGGDDALLQNTLTALSGEEPVIALAGWHMAGESGEARESAGSTSAPRMMLDGYRLSQPANAAQKTAFSLPADRDLWPRFAALDDGSGPGTPAMRFEAAKACYASMADREGDHSGRVNPGRWAEAMFYAVKGGGSVEQAANFAAEVKSNAEILGTGGMRSGDPTANAVADEVVRDSTLFSSTEVQSRDAPKQMLAAAAIENGPNQSSPQNEAGQRNAFLQASPDDLLKRYKQDGANKFYGDARKAGFDTVLLGYVMQTIEARLTGSPEIFESVKAELRDRIVHLKELMGDPNSTGAERQAAGSKSHFLDSLYTELQSYYRREDGLMEPMAAKIALTMAHPQENKTNQLFGFGIANAAASSAGRLNIFGQALSKSIRPGELINHGQYKQVFEVKSDKSKVVAFHRENDRKALEREIDDLNQLREAGAPVVKTHGVVEVGGRPAIVMDNYKGAKSVKAFGTLDDLNDAVSYLGKNSLSDLEKIRKIASKYDIEDFQVMITPEGRVLIHDPMSVTPVKGGRRPIINFVDSLIEDANKNAAKIGKGK